jgi:hypothetical protein
MTLQTSTIVLSLAFAAFVQLPRAIAQAGSASTSAVLVELFTSEGCSSCPPADELLREVNQQKSSEGQIIIGLSEHVSYWNGLGWKDPFSSDQYTNRQNGYSAKFHTEGPYTPQMVVNGREQFVGSDRGKLREALADESRRKQVQLHIVQAKLGDSALTFSYSAQDLSVNSPLQLMAAIVDDTDRSSVQRGENSGRSLQHVFVVRALASVATLRSDETKTVTLPLPPGFQSTQAHHLVLFAQEKGLGAVLGIDTKSL